MIKKIFFLIIIFVLASGLFLYFSSINQEVETFQKAHLTLDKNFLDFRKSLQQEDLMEKTISSLNGSILEKKWIEADVNIQRPILKNWHFKGKLNFKFTVPYEGNDFLFHVCQDLKIDNDQIDSENNLIESIDSLGLKKYQQKTVITKNENKTNVYMSVHIKVKRFIPFFLKEYAQKKLDEEGIKQIENLKNSMLELSNRKTKNNIFIKIK